MPVSDLQTALAALQREDAETAVPPLQRTVAEFPAHLTAHVLLALAYESQDQWEKALKRWAIAHTLLPNSPVVRDGKARVLRRMGPPADRSVADVLAEQESQNTENSELEALRRQVEKAARRGGAQPSPGDASEMPQPDQAPVDTPEERVEELRDDTSEDELDHLIEELESARIEPNPDVEDVPEPELEEEADVVSETLARIYESQGQYAEAAQVYEELASEEPDRADELRDRAAEMRKRADDEDSTAEDG